MISIQLTYKPHWYIIVKKSKMFSYSLKKIFCPVYLSVIEITAIADAFFFILIEHDSNIIFEQDKHEAPRSLIPFKLFSHSLPYHRRMDILFIPETIRLA
jgi:hypothetical protein